jgi:hypothetical protein
MPFLIFRSDKTGTSGTGNMLAGQTNGTTVPEVIETTKKVTGENPTAILKSGRYKNVHTENFEVSFIDKQDLIGGGITSLYDNESDYDVD